MHNPPRILLPRADPVNFLLIAHRDDSTPPESFARSSMKRRIVSTFPFAPFPLSRVRSIHFLLFSDCAIGVAIVTELEDSIFSANFFFSSFLFHKSQLNEPIPNI